MLALFGPARQRILDAVNKAKGSPLANAIMKHQEVSKYKMVIFAIILTIGFILLWPLFQISILKEKRTEKKEIEEFQPELAKGITYSQMGGYGKIVCECGYTENITSFTHGYVENCSGYQCQSCGKLTARNYRSPYPDYIGNGPKEPLAGVPMEYRPSAISYRKFMVSFIEGQMKTTPKKDWFSSWVRDLAVYQAEISSVRTDELELIERTYKKAQSDYELSLMCECGGSLSRDEILFCPSCKSKKLSYDMRGIT